MDFQIPRRPERPPGYTGKETRVHLIQITNIIPALIATLFVGLRLYVRLSQNTMGRDDILIVFGVGFMWGEVSFSLWGTSWGWGRHVWDVELDSFPKLWICFIGMQACYQFSAMFIQLSVLALYLRLSISIFFRKIVYMMALLAVSFMVARLTLVHCVPAPIPEIPPPSCPAINFSWRQGWYLMNITGIMTDSIIWLLPIPMLCMRSRETHVYADGRRGLRLRSRTLLDRKRVGLIITFSMGLGACIANAMKLALGVIDKAKDDGSWDGVMMQMFDPIELGLGIVGACLPALRVLFFSILPQWWKGVMGMGGNGPPNDREQVDRRNSDALYEFDSLVFAEESEESSTRALERQQTPCPGSQSDTHSQNVNLENDRFAHQPVHITKPNQHFQ